MTVREIIQLDFDVEQKDRELSDKVAEVLTAFDGKQCSKRLATALKKEFGCLVHYEPPGMMKSGEVVLWGKEINREYEHRIMYFLLQKKWDDPDRTFSIDSFIEHNIAHFAAAIERQEERKAQLESDYPENLQELIRQYDNIAGLIDEMTSVSDPSHYSIRREFSLRRAD